MEERESSQTPEFETPGQQWAKRLGVLGGVVVLLFSLNFVLTMLTAGPEAIPGYVPAQTDAYYALYPEQLRQELEEQVFPYVSGVEYCQVEDGKLVVGIRSRDFIETRAVIVNLFDQTLFEFREA